MKLFIKKRPDILFIDVLKKPVCDVFRQKHNYETLKGA